MSHWRRSPRPFGLAIDGVRDDLAPATLLAQLQRIWPEVAGEAIAAAAQPTAERAGVLTISCSASVWAQELDLMGPMIDEIIGHLRDSQGTGSPVAAHAAAPIPAPVGIRFLSSWSVAPAELSHMEQETTLRR